MLLGVTIDRIGALRCERTELLNLCHELSDDEWKTDSAARGWRVQDVVAHIGSACHMLFTPAALKMMRSADIERSNDLPVDQRRGWPPARTLAEYERWSKRLLRVAGPMSRPPLANVPVRLAELGRFPTCQLLGAMVFDHHTHLRHDIAPAVNRPAPPTDANRMAVVLSWMMAVLSNQLRASRPVWLDRPLSITLSGPGGGTWSIGTDGSIGPGGDDGVAHIDGVAVEFPEWATTRAYWRDRHVRVRGDIDYGTRFLDAVNVV
jgi:uncharacterized protein (TIGR03083 family)